MSAAGIVYRFGGFTLDLVRGALLTEAGEEVPLRAKSFMLLRLLVENAGRLLDRETINRAIWPDVTVTDGSISQCVSDARRVLGDPQNMIRTVPRRGYLFAAGVTASPGAAPVALGPTPVPSRDRPSIAVLAFANMSSDLGQDYFSDGIADDIVTELSRSHSLFVVARNSSFAYGHHPVDIKQIAQELGVRYVVQGSVRRGDTQVRITVQLVDAATARCLWAERYDRDVKEIFAVQDEITAAVVGAVLPLVGEAEQRSALRKTPGDLSTWETYQCGLWCMRKNTAQDTRKAQRLFEQTIVLDATFAPAHAALAMATMMRGVVYGDLPIGESAQLARELAGKAVEIDPADADAQAVLAFAFWTLGNFEAARERASLALGNNPNSPWANGISGALQIFGGHPSKGREAVLKALRLSPRDPRDANLRGQVSMSYYFEHDYERAAEAARSALFHHPDHPSPYRWLAASLGQLGQVDAAREAMNKAMALSPGSFEVNVRDRPRWFRPEDHAHMLDGLRKAGWRDQSW